MLMKENDMIRRGSMTVEAAFIMPVVIFVVCAICYISFYVHDKAVVESIINDSLERMNLLIKCESNIEGSEVSYENIVNRELFYCMRGLKQEETTAKEYILEQLKKKLCIMKVVSVECGCSFWELEVDVELQMKVSIPVVSGWFKQKARNIKRKCQLHYPEEFARIYDVLRVYMDSSGKGDIDTYYSEIKRRLYDSE